MKTLRNSTIVFKIRKGQPAQKDFKFLDSLKIWHEQTYRLSFSMGITYRFHFKGSLTYRLVLLAARTLVMRYAYASHTLNKNPGEL